MASGVQCRCALCRVEGGLALVCLHTAAFLWSGTALACLPAAPLCTLPHTFTHQYSDHLHAQEQPCTRPISIRKLLQLHFKTSAPKADSNLDKYLNILFLPRFKIKSCKSVEVEGSCAADAFLAYGRRRLQPSFHLLHGQEYISQLGTNLIGLQGITIPSGLPYGAPPPPTISLVAFLHWGQCVEW